MEDRIVMNVKAYTIRSFAITDNGGNPAAAVFDTNGLAEEQMKRIAREIGFSETAFVFPSQCADVKVRFFTPEEEVDLCGHATIGTWSLMHLLGKITAGSYTQETKAGILRVIVKEDSSVMMEQTLPVFGEYPDPVEIAESLGIGTGQLCRELPVQIVSTGLRDILVGIKDRKTLQEIEPDFAKVAEVSRKYEAVGYHLFTMETMEGGLAHCRNLAPLYGIAEEAATGTSSGALACYLYARYRIPEENVQDIVLEQGYTMGHPSKILVSLKTEEGKITEVMVGGGARSPGERIVTIG